ncbi:chemotaxis protein CheD [Evansella sp. LMS18]|uniref:chemotaxis protein CheD n=1 Tax=Evansella sp. LMS18 TaxID=2924033 RepID=UPI0020D0B63D|nr:chemotaxis protein CheD [Evansella sp. LMS18]UTR10844.1 chemotaxis protein CheD [Evansella sp. LMS18]
MNNVIRVGMADINFAASPSTIRTSGLGSCVGVVIYDEKLNIGGMAHIMLPDSSMSRGGIVQRAKYADTAVTDLVSYFHSKCKEGETVRLKAKIAGGAQMFQFSTSTELFRIGPRNVEAVKEQLKKRKVILMNEDTGGSSGRTIEFDPATKKLYIRTVNKGEKAI